ncbi:MAG: hypothetical protein K9J81_03440 [Desulfohalobiaceae bacterium]|nr:hypothetical protein [Desulfohalobiaceae bacterium]
MLVLIRLYFDYHWVANQAHEKKNCVHECSRIGTNENVIFQPADRRQKSFIPLPRHKSFIVFLPCRMAMAFACQPLIAGRQK